MKGKDHPSFTHGESTGANRTSEYGTWLAMLERCYNTNHVHYYSYGGRGIGVCDRWRNSYQDFLADMGRRPEGRTLDRKNNDESYSLENCKWSTKSEQNSNRSNNVIIEYNGQQKTLTQWSEITGLNPTTISNRLKRRWTIEKALTQSPLHGANKQPTGGDK